MSHTPLLQTLRRLAVDARESALTRRELEHVTECRAALTTRRAFIGKMGVAAAALTGAPLLRAAKPVKSKARVVIVGAGLAGLTCGYRLKQTGVDATVYEANSSVGGRCHTLRNYFLEGQIAEHGGELIDQSHASIRHLAQELKLPLDNVLAAEPNHTEAFFHFGGSRYSYKDATGDLKGIWQTLHGDFVRREHALRGHRRRAGRQRPFLRRAHVNRCAGLPRGRRGNGRARGGRDYGGPAGVAGDVEAISRPRIHANVREWHRVRLLTQRRRPRQLCG